MSITTKLVLCLMEDLKTTQYLYNRIWFQGLLLLLHYSERESWTADRGIPDLFDKYAVIHRKNNLRRMQITLTLVPCLYLPTSLPSQRYHSPSWKILLTMFPRDAKVEKLENKLELKDMWPWGRHLLFLYPIFISI